MTLTMFGAILPQLIIAFGITLALLLVAWKRSQHTIAFFTLAVLGCAFIANLMLSQSSSIQVTQLLKVDGYSLFAFNLILIAAMVAIRLSSVLLRAYTDVHDEYYLLVLLMVLGAGILVTSDHFASLFLGFELLSISFVGLVGYHREGRYSVETGFKYLVLSATASSFMLLGIAFIYSQTGNLSFAQQISAAVYHHQDVRLFYNLGLLLFVAGIAFKLSLAPFHLWVADVYQGAPTPVTMLMSTVSKVAMFVVLLKCCIAQNYLLFNDFQLFLSILAMLSMIIGNTLALKQQNLKRLIAYSSIAHMGYLLIVVIIIAEATLAFTWQGALFYLAAYVVANLSIFTVISIIEQQAFTGPNSKRLDNVELSHFTGLFWQQRSLAVLLIVALLSLAGIPLTMGFIGKFYLLTQATLAHAWWLISVLIIGSGIGLVYYLRIIFILFSGDQQQPNANAKQQTVLMDNLLVLGFIFVGILLGVLPDLLSRFMMSPI